jgi:hypothetical protein
MFLTEDELVRLTGRHQTAAQIRQLEKRGYVYDLDADGRILVTKEHVLRKLDNRAANDDKIAVPDFSGRRHGRQKATA